MHRAGTGTMHRYSTIHPVYCTAYFQCQTMDVSESFGKRQSHFNFFSHLKLTTGTVLVPVPYAIFSDGSVPVPVLT
jgi:hypothetical protein